MLILVTDFGLEGPYIGQVQAVLQQQAPGIPLINLFSDLTPFAIQDAAYLLPAYAAGFPAGSVFLCVVDPGVGGRRPGVVVQADERWYVGPDEGLFALVTRRAHAIQSWRLPEVAGAAPSFHGRDVFAPAAAYLARNRRIITGWEPCPVAARADWPNELPRVVYIDRFGNAITGVRAATVPPAACLSIAGRTLTQAPTFSAVAAGEPFWYANSSGLVEIAVNRGRADTLLGIEVGTVIGFQENERD
jgi:S-adenosylmethionine hydrolase